MGGVGGVEGVRGVRGVGGVEGVGGVGDVGGVGGVGGMVMPARRAAWSGCSRFITVEMTASRSTSRRFCVPCGGIRHAVKSGLATSAARLYVHGLCDLPCER